MSIEQRRTIQFAVDVIRSACKKNALPHELDDAVWELTDLILHDSYTWAQEESYSAPDSHGDLFGRALNSLTGDSVRLLIEVALWDYRHQSLDGLPGVDEVWRDRVAALLDTILERTGNSAQPALFMLGTFLPQIFLLCPEWMSDKANDLIDPRFSEWKNSPSWVAYLTTTHVYGVPFSVLRQFYIASARIMADDRTSTSDDTSDSPLFNHCRVAGGMLA